MSRKILKVGGILAAPFTGGASLALTAGASMLPKKGKKGAQAQAATPTTPQKGPIVTPLGGSASDPIRERLRRAVSARQGGSATTILSNKLGG